MALVPKGIFIVGAKRTPFGRYGGFLKDIPTSHVFAAAAKDALKCAGVDAALVDTTVVGNVNFLSQCDGGKTPRYCGTYAGVPLSRPALGVNKACGSGYQAIISGVMDMLTGVAKVALTGGTENMSSLPMLVRNVRFGSTLGAAYQFEEYIGKQALDSYSNMTLLQLVEHFANENGITRQEVDEYALESHRRWKAASSRGVFSKEITPVTVMDGDHEVVFEADSWPKPELKMEEVAKLRPILDGGIITAGNSSPVADGASALVLADEESIRTHSWKPLARIVGWACVGVDPSRMPEGAVTAAEKLLKVAQLNMEDVDLVEINDSYAAHTLACAKQLRVQADKLNVNGGAVALGHAPGASTARVATHLAHQLTQTNAKRALGTTSCGGGQGIAIMLEKV